MGSTYFATTLILMLRCLCALGETFMFDPNVQFQHPVLNMDNRFLRPTLGLQARAQSRNPMDTPQQPFLHKVASPQKVITESERSRDAKNNTVSTLVDALNVLAEPEPEEKQEERSSVRDYAYPQYGYSPASYGYPPRPTYGQAPSYHDLGYPPRPSYGPLPSLHHEPAYPQRPSYGPPPYHEAEYPPKPSYTSQPSSYQEPAHSTPPVHHSASKTLDLLKPVTTKVAGKVSGLIGLVLALLTGSAPDDLEMKGFKDIVINGIVKPLLIAKGGIKSLISKLAIPVISLLLINLEVLITIWWLWEDCPEPVHTPPPPYSYPKPSYIQY